MIEHPLINDAQDLPMEDLQSRISDLQRKFNWARRHNAALAHQISMALNTYTNRYQELQRQAWEKQSGSSPDYSDRIDIS
jgi:hypothetical protein